MDMDSRLLTVADFASMAQISRPLAYQLVNRPDFPAIRLGRCIRINRDAALRWLEGQSKGVSW